VIVVVMGVSGVGKSTIGTALASHLGWHFLDADDFHPRENVAKMAAGTPLTDDDRWPWLDRLNEALRKEQDAVLACSALKEAYRRRLLEGIARYQVVHLRGEFDLINARLAERRHRYMPAALLQSQFSTLEPPSQAIEIDVAMPVGDCVAAIAARLAR
jgi:gluconokinase